MCQALSWVPDLTKHNLNLGSSQLAGREETVFAKRCDRTGLDTCIRTQTQPGASNFPNTHAYLPGIFAGENKSSSEAKIICPKPSVKNYLFGMGIGKMMNPQAKSSGDPHGLPSFRHTRLWRNQGMCFLLALKTQVTIDGDGVAMSR